MADEALHGLGVLPDVPARHERVVMPGELLITSYALLKWYELRTGAVIISRDVTRDARRCVQAAIEVGALPYGDGFGFAVLRYEPPEVSLLVGVWHGEERLHEARFIQIAGGAFEEMPNAHGATASTIRDLAVMWHERGAWMRYLRSARGEEAKCAYLNERLLGLM